MGDPGWDGGVADPEAFSPDGKTLAIGTADNTISLWDITNPTSPAQIGETITGPSSYVYSVQFSPDGKTLVAGSADNLVRLWDITNLRKPTLLGKPLTGPTNYVNAIAFNSDSSLLAASGGDGSIWLWNAHDRERPELLANWTAHAGSVYIIGFDPTRNVLASGSSDKTARLWLADAGQAAAYVCAIAGDPITPQEWEKYLPGTPYDPPCP